MLEWLMENKEWIFSGIGVAALSGLIWLVRVKWNDRNKGGGNGGSDRPSINQRHNGSGDNVGRDKNSRG